MRECGSGGTSSPGQWQSPFWLAPAAITVASQTQPASRHWTPLHGWLWLTMGSVQAIAPHLEHGPFTLEADFQAQLQDTVQRFNGFAEKGQASQPPHLAL